MRAVAVPVVVTVTVAVAAGAGCRNARTDAPVVVACPVDVTMTAGANVYESLVDVDTSLQMTPGLAKAWYTPDANTWVFDLEPGVHFHDGTPLTTAEVVASIERARTDPLLRGLLTAVESVAAAGPLQVVVRTSYPFGPLPLRLSRVPVDRRAGTDRPLGTGPFRVKAWPKGGTAVLEAFDGYRKGRPSIPLVEFRTIADPEARVRALRDGTVQLALDVPHADLAALRQDPQVEVSVEKGTTVLFLGMDCSHPTSPHVAAPANPFRDVRVREAVALGVDRGRLVARALGGLGHEATQLAVAEVFGHHDRLERYPYDPAEARRLLGAAGYPSGFAVQLDYTRGGHRDVEALVQAVVSDLAAVGIRATPRPQERLVARLETRDTAFYLTRVVIEGPDVSSAFEYFLHTRRDGYGQLNAGGYSNPEVDRWLEEAARQLLPQERGGLLRHVAEQVHLDVPVVPLVVPADAFAGRRELQFTPRLDRQVRLADTRWTAAPAP
jgi:peptide/nickel transport system substrate-binding protein